MPSTAFINMQNQSLYEKSIKGIQKSFSELTEENKALRKEIQFLKSEHYKDEEIKKYKEQAERAIKEAENGFAIPEHIHKKMKKWEDKHVREKHWDAISKCPTSTGAVGGRFTYEFTPTSIGTLIACKCMCGESISEMD